MLTTPRSRLAELFPQPPPQTRPRSLVIAITAGGAALIALCALLRQPGVAATSSFWAEDGEILYQAVIAHSFLAAVTTPYDGYLQLVPRLAIELTHLAGVARASAIAALAGDLILAACSLTVFHAARGLLPSVFSRVLLVAAMVLLPLANGELLNDIINTPWWLLFACFWVLLWRPRTRAGLAFAAAFCFLTAASTPVAAFYLPIVAARWVALPRLREQAAAVGLITGLALQLPAIITAPSGGSVYPHSTSHIASLFLLRVATGSLAGVAGVNALVAHASTIGIVLGIVLLVATGGLVVVCRSLQVRLFAAAALYACVVLFAFELWYRGAGLWMNGEPAIYGGRYAAVPLLLLLSLLVMLAGRWASRGKLALGTVLLAACLVPAWAIDFQTANWRAAGPDWPADVAAARAQCPSSGLGTIRIPTAPAGWSVLVPCALLR